MGYKHHVVYEVLGNLAMFNVTQVPAGQRTNIWTDQTFRMYEMIAELIFGPNFIDVLFRVSLV